MSGCHPEGTLQGTFSWATCLQPSYHGLTVTAKLSLAEKSLTCLHFLVRATLPVWPESSQRYVCLTSFPLTAVIILKHTTLVAQCSATPATVAATPPCSATPFQTQISVRHLPVQGGGRCDTKIFRGCSATPVLHLQNAIKSRKSAATRVARQEVPAIVCN